MGEGRHRIAEVEIVLIGDGVDVGHQLRDGLISVVRMLGEELQKEEL